MLTIEQLERRRGCIGGSDIAKIVTNTHGGLMSVCDSKWNPPAIETPSIEAELGNAAEGPIIQWAQTQPDFADTHFTAFYVSTKACHRVGPYPIAVNCDCIVDDGEHHHDAPLSAKLVFHYGMPAWESGPSKYAQVQLQTEMLCTGSDHGFIAAWFVSTGEKKLWRIERDQATIDAIIELAQTVWREYIEPHKIPPINEGNAELAYEVLSKFPRIAATECELSGDIVLEAVQELQTIRYQQAHVRKQEPLSKAIILQAMGDATIGRLPDGRHIQLSTIKKKAYTVDASEYIKISIKGESNVGAATDSVSDNVATANAA